MTTTPKATGYSASSGNATKAGIYSDRTLAGEDPQKLVDMTQALIDDYGVQSFTGKRLCSDLALVMLKQDRAERHLHQLSQSHLAKNSVREEFCRELGIDSMITQKLPNWIFNGDKAMRSKSRWLLLVQQQANHLLANHCATLMMQVQQQYPELWDFVVGKNLAKVKIYTFAEMLCQYSKHSEPHFKIKDLIDHLTQKYAAELLWATDEARFEQVLADFVNRYVFDTLMHPNFQRGVAYLERQQKDLIDQILALEVGLEPDGSQVLKSSQGKLLQIRANAPKVSSKASGQEPDDAA